MCSTLTCFIFKYIIFSTYNKKLYVFYKLLVHVLYLFTSSNTPLLIFKKGKKSEQSRLASDVRWQAFLYVCLWGEREKGGGGGEIGVKDNEKIVSCSKKKKK